MTIDIDLDDSYPYNPAYTFRDGLSLKERSQNNRKYQISKKIRPEKPKRAGTCLAYLDDPSARFKILDLREVE